MDPVFFVSGAQLRAWLAEHHAAEPELWVGYYKKGSGKPSITYAESVDEALCFGWIDGIRKTVDAESYTIRFTPRRRNSIWSAVNLKRFAELSEAGLVQPAGYAIYNQRDPEKVNRYSFEEGDRSLSAEYEQLFRANTEAWAFFETQPPGYRRAASWWVMSAKRPETQRSRLSTLINDSHNGKRIAMLDRSSR